MCFPKYEKYKDSGVKWLGKVPEHWNVDRLRFIFEIVKRIAGTDGFDVLSITQRGIKVKDLESGEGQLSSDYSKYQIVKKGNFAMNHMDLLTGYVDVSQFNGVTSPDYRVFQLSDEDKDYSQYFLHLLQNGYHQRLFFPYGQGAAHLGRWRLPKEEFNNFLFPRPPLGEQVKVAQFLEYNTSRIDALIAEQERLIALLKEKRQAVISHAVTKGLDTTVKMKDSGVEWLGEVPEHWEITKLKYAIDEYGGSTPSKENLDYWNGDIPWVTPKDMKREVIEDSIDHVSTLAIEETNLSILPKQVVLIVVRGMILAHSVPVALTTTDTTINQDMKAMKPIEKFSADYLLLLLQGMKNAVFSFVDNSAHGTKKIEWERFKNIPVPVLEWQEQTEIVSKTRENIHKVDLLHIEVNRSIDTLKERRSALISAAVTGKIDVRNWQPPADIPSNTEEAIT